ncbi:MAG: XdhC/CoxI family protein [Candidatus Omnitrophica bacterium]|nr:XdhC/CoxI family protein [Candidatus Omnitrophota bacterium]
MDPVIKKAYEAARRGQSYAFATVVDSTVKGTPRKAGAKMVVFADGSLEGTIGGGRNEKAATAACLEAIKAGQPRTVIYNYFGREGESVCGGQIKVFIEPFMGKQEFVICGAGHIALPLSFLMKLLGFKVVIIDNRKEFANKKRFPHVDQIIVGHHADKLAQLAMDQNTYIMVVTQGNEFDFECLKVAINSSATYIGVISSKAKRIKFFNRLKEQGISRKLFRRIKIPAGVDVGAQTPEEIAISISAEVIALRNKNHLGTAKFVEKSSI